MLVPVKATLKHIKSYSFIFNMENKQNKSTPKIDNKRYLKLIVKQKTTALKNCEDKLIEYENIIERQQKMIDHLLTNIVQVKTENDIEQQLFR
ncbi:unnamed protein product [Didymodactylos carnosus]|uniref:Uncharacterized protein n=1 Tax=Didymodactylos carnosus TaxID=1234261 RepID=A0A814MZB4_9BILA|nr:unnamed protein product [Didymodactylos carnosus]CAF3849036.1 unnamed protein product [Didymodactylos carnosus]